MIEVLQVLGVGTYVQDFVNEMPEPNSNRARPPDQLCFLCDGIFERTAASIDMNNDWQGVCKKANEAPCYSPQGYHISIYEIMNYAPSFPDAPIQPDNEHAFVLYAWQRLDQNNNWVQCPHLPIPW